MAKLDMDSGVERVSEWPAVLDRLILGVSHQISNRVATLSGVSDILAGDPSVPPILRALADEVPKLAESVRLLRLLAVPSTEREEALEVYRLVDDAIALARLSPDAREVDYAVEDGRGAPPVLAAPITLTHALVIALTSAAAAAARDGLRTVPVRFSVGAPDMLISAGSISVRARLLSAARDRQGSAPRSTPTREADESR